MFVIELSTNDRGSYSWAAFSNWLAYPYRFASRRHWRVGQVPAKTLIGTESGAQKITRGLAE
jgi:hypothetical protein